MTNEEFFTMLDEKFGEDWTPSQIESTPELYDEYNKRIATGIK